MPKWDELGKLEEVNALIVLDRDRREIYSKLPGEYEKLREWIEVFDGLINDAFKELKASPRAVIVEYFNHKMGFFRCMDNYFIFLTPKLVDIKGIYEKIREIEIAKKVEEALRF